MYHLLGSNYKTSAALRAKVMTQVKALGGLDVEWEQKMMTIADIGEYGHQRFSRAMRWVIKVTLDDPSSSEHGIKRRKLDGVDSDNE